MSWDLKNELVEFLATCTHLQTRGQFDGMLGVRAFCRCWRRHPPTITEKTVFGNVVQDELAKFLAGSQVERQRPPRRT